MACAYLGIGANLGARVRTCLRAVEALAGLAGTRVCARSGLYETEPLGVTDQPRFVNLAVQLETGLAPEDLLAALQAIERDLGRRPGDRWGPRVIDLDLLFYDQRVIDAPGLCLPHPRLAERRFVLAPLAEIAPELRHPILGHSMSKLLADLGDAGGWVRALDDSVNSA